MSTKSKTKDSEKKPEKEKEKDGDEKNATKNARLPATEPIQCPCSTSSSPPSSAARVVPAQRPAAAAPAKPPPVSSQQALVQFARHLTKFELEELKAPHDVFYAGQECGRKNSTAKKEKDFDDENGQYRVVLKDHLNYRYKIERELGEGEFSKVVGALDLKEQRKVAVKIARADCRNLAAQEIVILNKLRKLNAQTNDHYTQVMAFYDSFQFRSHQCIVVELLEGTLLDILQEKSFKPRSLLPQLPNISFDVVHGLHFLHTVARMVHTDLKPENILYAERKSGSMIVKIADFGSTRNIKRINRQLKEQAEKQTERRDDRPLIYLQSRYYRSPEILLGGPITEQIDIWSLGCILAEAITGQTLFHGRNCLHQVQLIYALLGEFPDSLVKVCNREVLHRFYCDETDFPKSFMEPDGENDQSISCKSKTLREVLGLREKEQDDLVDFLTKCLALFPLDRLTTGTALEHKFLSRRNGKSPK